MFGHDTDLPWICPSITKIVQDICDFSVYGFVAFPCFILPFLICFEKRNGVKHDPEFLMRLVEIYCLGLIIIFDVTLIRCKLGSWK